MCVCFPLLVFTLGQRGGSASSWRDTWVQIPRLGYILNDEKVAEGTWNRLGT